MPYRGDDRATTKCYRHPVAPAGATCARCGCPLCEPCTLFDGPSASCFHCQERTRAHRRGRRALIYTLAASAALSVVAAIAFIALHRSSPGESFLRVWEEQLERSPCDTSTNAAVFRELLAESRYQEVIDRVRRYQRACANADVSLAWYELTALRRLGGANDAFELAEARVRQTPAIARDFANEAILEQPRDETDALELATLVERIDQACLGSTIIRGYLAHHLRSAGIDDRIRHLKSLGCKSPDELDEIYRVLNGCEKEPSKCER
jgi:hypothetical protein